MKLTLQVMTSTDDGQQLVQELLVLEREGLQPDTVGLTLAESKTLLRTLQEVMVEHQVRHLPVKDGHALVGVLSDRDLKRALDPDLGLPPKDELFVRDIFVAEAYMVDTHESLDAVLHHLSTHHIGSALVTKSGRLAGIFTATDACRIFCQHLRSLFPSRSGDEVA